jgi:tellurite resistance protein TerC
MFWAALGLSFSVVIYALAASRYGSEIARQAGLEYVTGYLVEESLSIDNMFVFALVFRYFSLGPEHQHRVLLYGVLGAMIFRGVFVATGAALIRFPWVLIAFGIVLVLSGLRMALAGESASNPSAICWCAWSGEWSRLPANCTGTDFSSGAMDASG